MTAEKSDDSPPALFVRGIPEEVVRKVRAAAALAGKGFPAYLRELLEAHVADLERKGQLPKSKG